jgi:hypothetical protein
MCKNLQVGEETRYITWQALKTILENEVQTECCISTCTSAYGLCDETSKGQDSWWLYPGLHHWHLQDDSRPYVYHERGRGFATLGYRYGTQ